MSKHRSYSELKNLKTWEERFDYLKLGDRVGAETFGMYRYLYQAFLKSAEWKQLRNHIIVRDNGCDLGIEGYDIVPPDLLMKRRKDLTVAERGLLDLPIIHHINPIRIDDLTNVSDLLMDPDNLITVTFTTHNAIHYGVGEKKPMIIERTPNDTCPWKE